MPRRCTSPSRPCPAPRCRRSCRSSMPRPRPPSNAPGRSSNLRNRFQIFRGGTIMRKLAVCSVVLLMLAATPAMSLSDKPYLADTDADFANLLPPPPADGSARDKRDMQALLDLQKTLTPERLERIQADTEQSVYRVAGEVLGPTFTKDRFPLAGAFFDKVNKDSVVGGRTIKQKYKRLRPFQRNKEGQSPPELAAAYPAPHH